MTKAERETLKAEFVTGDYRTLKEFAEKKDISYSEIRKVSSQDNWVRTKREHEEQIAHKTCAKAVQKRVEDGLRNVTVRQDKTLSATERIREVATALLSKPGITAKEVNAIASALYRVNEIERGILIGTESASENGGLEIIISDCSEVGSE